MKIRHIYLEIDEGSFRKPNIKAVTVMGFHELTKISKKETTNPKIHAN